MKNIRQLLPLWRGLLLISILYPCLAFSGTVVWSSSSSVGNGEATPFKVLVAIIFAVATVWLHFYLSGTKSHHKGRRKSASTYTDLVQSIKNIKVNECSMLCEEGDNSITIRSPKEPSFLEGILSENRRYSIKLIFDTASSTVKYSESFKKNGWNGLTFKAEFSTDDAQGYFDAVNKDGEEVRVYVSTVRGKLFEIINNHGWDMQKKFL
ncbi:hypothetical protein QCD60_10290 [Pokkaliibacter sp. MBI-7]|uniref:hypothetical protein n=1 Tax=Pokkaliibacter sp. MBI-7 TaxID=3040600 RepID=UPI002449B275|nr:hypothetical protein [Pokkaliibacter sp. MBI-7]MDH2432955.1 hypothetical protein [Pokkaliibacter sp. MBI-7]